MGIDWAEHAVGFLEAIPGALIFTLLLAVYVAPWIVAAHRDHPREKAIFRLSFFLGWTVVAWVVAMVWAMRAVEREDG